MGINTKEKADLGKTVCSSICWIFPDEVTNRAIRIYVYIHVCSRILYKDIAFFSKCIHDTSGIYRTLAILTFNWKKQILHIMHACVFHRAVLIR